jgi:hypothetical protein
MPNHTLLFTQPGMAKSAVVLSALSSLFCSSGSMTYTLVTSSRCIGRPLTHTVCVSLVSKDVTEITILYTMDSPETPCVVSMKASTPISQPMGIIVLEAKGLTHWRLILSCREEFKLPRHEPTAFQLPSPSSVDILAI